MKDKIIKQLNIYTEVQKDVYKALRDFFRDTDISLDDRWEIFVLSCKNKAYNNYDQYIWNNEIIEDELYLTWCDDFYFERHETIEFTRIINVLEECLEDDFYGVTQNHIDRIKEDILQSGYSGFVYDW